MKMDISVKRVQFISKNNEILQEFNFSYPKTKISINSIYNSHFTGSCLWDLFSAEAVTVYSTWNTAMKLMMNLPIQTHIKLIETLSQIPHIRSVLMRRFLNFLEQIEKSGKEGCKMLLRTVKNDTNSITGSNLRNILLETEKISIQELSPSDCLQIKYFPLNEEENWKVRILNELIDATNEQLGVSNFDIEELQTMFNHACVY